uniref:Serum response factor homolog n=1 Tax=Ornithodoros turicata TaxID=34597 RepID=A0A2R5LC28_9ACAR
MQATSDHEELKALGFSPFDTHLLADSSVLDSIMSGKRTSDDAAFSLDDVQLTEPTPKKVPPPNGKKTKGRVKIKMEFIDNKLRRYTTFSKRKTGIMKKAYELSTLTGTQVMLLVASETGHVYTFATRKLQPMITSEAGKALIQTCLNSPDPPASGQIQATGPGATDQRMSATGFEETELTYSVSDDCENKESKALFGSLLGNDDDSESENSSHNSSSPPPLAPQGTGARSVTLPMVPAGTLVYHTPQGGLVYAPPGSAASTEALLLNLGQTTAPHDVSTGSSAQQFITIPVAVSQSQQVLGGLTTWPGTTTTSTTLSTSQRMPGGRGQPDKL